MHICPESELSLPFYHCKVFCPLAFWVFFHATAFYSKVENPLQKPLRDNDKATFSITEQTSIFSQVRHRQVCHLLPCWCLMIHDKSPIETVIVLHKDTRSSQHPRELVGDFYCCVNWKYHFFISRLKGLGQNISFFLYRNPIWTDSLKGENG